MTTPMTEAQRAVRTAKPSELSRAKIALKALERAYDEAPLTWARKQRQFEEKQQERANKIEAQRKLVEELEREEQR